MDRLEPEYADGSRWIIDASQVWTEQPYVDLTFQVHQAAGGLTGAYKYAYTYTRTAIQRIEGNPSSNSPTVNPSTQSVTVTVIGSSDAQVDEINIYRTLAGGATTMYKVDTIPDPGDGVSVTYKDVHSDNDITTLLDFNNTIPPRAKYLGLHKDRVFYANCPFEENGGSLVMWSKSGNGEAVPTLNYQYFDKADGEEITGVASLSDYFIVFKSSKIGILAGELDVKSQLWYLSRGIGCISNWTIIAFEDKIMFLSEEGWKATDGKNIWDLSSKINRLVGDGYFISSEGENYSAVYYPEKEQFQFLANHSTLTNYVFVGHLLMPLLLEGSGASELETGNIVGWSYHQYASDELTCLGTYTNSSGITKLIAGASDGFVYELDSGNTDDGAYIATSLKTDWLS